MPPAPRGVRISYGPSLAPVDSGIRLIQFSVADREAVKSCVTAHPEIGRLPESAFRAPQHLPIPVHWTESGLCFPWAAMVGPTGPVYGKAVSRPLPCGHPRTGSSTDGPGGAHRFAFRMPMAAPLSRFLA